MRYQLYLGDCLDILPTLAAGSVDAIIADPPYGTTACKWDSVIPLDDLWAECKRVIKSRGAIVLFGSQPFTSQLVMSNLGWFKYCWTWDKKTGKGHLVAKIRPLQQTEDVVIFGKGKITYNPICTPQKQRRLKEYSRTEIMGGKSDPTYERMTDFLYPKTLLHFPWSPAKTLHPTQKPVALLEYLVKTYTNEGDTVLDFCFGSGTTGAACIKTGRNFIGMERDPGYYEIARQRLDAEAAKHTQMGLI